MEADKLATLAATLMAPHFLKAAQAWAGADMSAEQMRDARDRLAAACVRAALSIQIEAEKAAMGPETAAQYDATRQTPEQILPRRQ